MSRPGLMTHWRRAELQVAESCGAFGIGVRLESAKDGAVEVG